MNTEILTHGGFVPITWKIIFVDRLTEDDAPVDCLRDDVDAILYVSRLSAFPLAVLVRAAFPSAPLVPLLPTA